MSREEIAKNDFNISPSRYIQTGEADEYRPIADIMEELRDLETDAAQVEEELKELLANLGV
jgi:type I restriction enzyme M protein